MKRMRLNGNLCNVPDVVAERERGSVCGDPDCGLSGGDAHAGDCEECDCGLGHAALECRIAHEAGWGER